MARRVRSSETFEKTERRGNFGLEEGEGPAARGPAALGAARTVSIPVLLLQQLKTKTFVKCVGYASSEHKSLLKSFWGRHA